MFVRTSIVLLLLFTVLSCQLLKISENENRGINEVVSIYGGVCIYSKEGTISTEEEDRRWKFVLTIRNSELIEKTPDQAEAFAGGVAYAFYKHLQDEKRKYSHIKTVLVNKDSSRQEYEFDLMELAVVKRKMPIAENIAANIIAKQFDAISPLLMDSSYLLADKKELLQNIVKTESDLDNAIAFVPLGFWRKRIDGHNNLHIVGQIKRKPQSTSFSVDIDIDASQNQAVFINYTY